MAFRASTLSSIAVLLVFLAGCGSSTAPPGDPGGDPPSGGETIDVGSLQIEVASAASTRTTTFHASPDLPATFTAIWGSRITRLSGAGWAEYGMAYSSNESGNYEIWMMRADGTNPVPLASGSGPSCSPDGQWIVFNDAGNNIRKTKSDGSSSDGLGVRGWGCAWSPDGSLIAYRGDTGLRTMEPDGAGQTDVTTFPPSDDNPTWSPDSKRLAFDRFDTNIGDHEIFAIDLDGSNLTRLTTHPGMDMEPNWSPDGSKIVFVSDRDDGWVDLYAMDADGSHVTQLTDDTETDENPRWSPDGRQIAFVKHIAAQSPEIYVMNADGSSPTRLTYNGAWDRDPDWCASAVASPNRTLIGPLGSDDGFDPPLGEARPVAVVALTDLGIVGGCTVKVDQPWDQVQAEKLTDTGSRLAGVKITGPPIRKLFEDMGQGRERREYMLTGAPPARGVLVFFSGTSGRITTVIAIGDRALDAPAATTASDRLTLRGSFVEAYDYRNPSRNLLGPGVSEVLLDADTGEIVLPN